MERVTLMVSALTISKLFNNKDTKNGGEARKYERFGSLQGARVGIVAKPSAEFVAGVLGTWFSGGVAVPLALSYPEAKLLYVMNNSVRRREFITRSWRNTTAAFTPKGASRSFLGSGKKYSFTYCLIQLNTCECA
ncbi:hypothetical protein Bca52824_030447 [Brassica carinata]|uniref:AMP-dependent synthetase/ligase domain-containing protein n=1 Tax=Brassica carinata TaxID=52824 RepID=A0A8X7S8X2_BRACI|nr:hypothetical protein Bca52824_030447 [Brassica carinata]